MKVLKQLRIAAVLAAGLILARHCWAAPTTAPAIRDEAFLGSALPHDPADIRGQFANGLHYLIRHNSNPPGKVSMNLAVRTGSLNETDEQNGLAHFLEHMAFKGSTHYAPTRLIPMLTHLGMRFGADTNAHTNHYETVFKLTMPDTKPETIDLALTIFSDYDNGLSLFPIQIESERRVILEEMRSRRNVSLREQKEENNLLFPGSQMAAHDVLGDPEIIKTAKAPLFTEYWNQWYRPENMTLIVVGDVVPDAVIAQAKPLLGAFTARAPAKVPTTAGIKPFEATKAVVMSDPEQVSGEIELVGIKPVRPAITTVLQYRQQLIESMAHAIVNRRLSDSINVGNAPFQSAEVGAGDFLRDKYVVNASGSGEPADWKKVLGGIIVEVNGAIKHGFSEHELDIVRRSMLANAARGIKTEPTLDSTALVTSLTTAVDTDLAMLSSAQDDDLLKQLLPGISLSDLQNAFIGEFAGNQYAYVLKLPTPAAGVLLPSEKDVLETAALAWQQPTPSLPAEQVASLLPADPAPGAVASRQLDADLGITTIVFQNGVVMHHRFSDYKKDQVLVQVILPGGILEETQANHGISEVASLMVSRPATSRLSSLQIRDIFSDKNVEVSGGIGLDSLSIGVTGSPTDIPLGLQLVRAILTDGKLEAPAVEEWKKATLQSLRSKPMLAEPQVADAMSELVMGGDARFAPMTPDLVQRQQRDLAQAWFKRIAENAAMEVTVVGDVSADDATSLVGKFLGSLPDRAGKFTDLDALRHVTRGPGPLQKSIHYQGVEPKAVVKAGFIGCDELDPERRPLALASLILTERMIQRIRFDQQLVYSINCTSVPSHGLPGTGMISASAPTDPHNADRLGNMILSIIKELGDKAPSQDELATAKKQMANQFASQMIEPAFWIAQVSELNYHHRSLDQLKQVPGIYQTYTADEVQNAVRKYATDDRLVCIKVLPASE